MEAAVIDKIGALTANIADSARVQTADEALYLPPGASLQRSERVLRGQPMPDLEPDGRAIDRIIGTVGVAGVVVIAFLLLVEQVIAWTAS